MRNRFIFLLSLALILSLGIVIAEGTTANTTPALFKIHIMGNGIAVNPSDLTDFKLIKSVVATFRDSNTTVVRGAMVIDQVRYVVKGTIPEEAKFVGELFKNTTKVGDISLSKIEKPDGEVWAGTLSIDGTNYYAYIMGVRKTFTARELAVKLGEYCKENPTDERCNGVAFVCGSDSIGQCQNKIQTYCESHQDDARCKALALRVCKNSTDDTRCRELLRNRCNVTDATNAAECGALNKPLLNVTNCLANCRIQANATCQVASAGERLPCLFRENAACLTKCAPSTVLPVTSTAETGVQSREGMR